MPGDVLGTNIFDFQTNLRLTKGPIFTEILLADEINRTPAQDAGGAAPGDAGARGHHRRHDHRAGREFMVVATQNPIEQQGTYPLPEAQLDRFLFKIVIEYPDRDSELEIVRRHGHQPVMPQARSVRAARRRRDGSAARDARRGGRITLSEEVIAYIVDIVRPRAAMPASNSEPRLAPPPCWPRGPAPAP